MLCAAWVALHAPCLSAQEQPDPQQVALGKIMYRDGVLPSGELMAGRYAGDVRVTGAQVICGACHRRSGLGSSEGQEVVPAVTGDILYAPLRLPTSKPPLAPEQRPAYTDATLKRAIREGIGADGKPFSPLMPRYPLADEDLDTLIAYLKTLSAAPDPGVTDQEIHFATILPESLDPAVRKAVLDVFETFVAQKNTETRHESQRAERAPWHKQWIFGAYRKWVLHVWDLKGPADTWPAQLQALYDRQPVFAVLGGAAPGSWQPVHDFCERNAIPCLFPATDLPVVDERDFYSVYLTRGMALEADAVARHLHDERLQASPIVQVYRSDDPRGQAAAAEFREQVGQQGGGVTDLAVTDASVLSDGFWRSALDETGGGTLVAWLGKEETAGLWNAASSGRPARIYLSSSLYGLEPGQVAPGRRADVYLVHPYELPDKLPRLLARSTGWLRVRGILAPEAQREQADTYFTLKMFGGALKTMRGYFVRELLIERVEHMVDLASYTSVYPRVRLAPGQRFVSKGSYILQWSAGPDAKLAPVTEWIVP